MVDRKCLAGQTGSCHLAGMPPRGPTVKEEASCMSPVTSACSFSSLSSERLWRQEGLVEAAVQSPLASCVPAFLTASGCRSAPCSWAVCGKGEKRWRPGCRREGKKSQQGRGQSAHAPPQADRWAEPQHRSRGSRAAASPAPFPAEPARAPVGTALGSNDTSLYSQEDGVTKPQEETPRSRKAGRGAGKWL